MHVLKRTKKSKTELDKPAQIAQMDSFAKDRHTPGRGRGSRHGFLKVLHRRQERRRLHGHENLFQYCRHPHQHTPCQGSTQCGRSRKQGGRSQDRGILPTSSPAAAQRSTASNPSGGKTGSASSRLPLPQPFPHPLSLPLSLPLDLARGGNPRRRSSALRAYPPPPPLPSRLHLQQRFAETQVSFAETQVSASEVPTLTQIKSQKSVP